MQSIGYRVVGPTVALTVGIAQHAAVAVLTTQQAEQAQFAAFTSSGGTTPVAVCVVTAQLPATGTAATPVLVFPVDGTPTVPASFILPPNMPGPLVVAVPTGQGGGFSVSAIGLTAGTTTVYITPLVAQ